MVLMGDWLGRVSGVSRRLQQEGDMYGGNANVPPFPITGHGANRHCLSQPRAVRIAMQMSCTASCGKLASYRFSMHMTLVTFGGSAIASPAS